MEIQEERTLLEGSEAKDDCGVQEVAGQGLGEMKVRAGISTESHSICIDI